MSFGTCIFDKIDELCQILGDTDRKELTQYQASLLQEVELHIECITALSVIIERVFTEVDETSNEQQW